MKVLNICADDYANYSFDNAQALRAVGVDANSIKSIRHPFKYAQESQIVSIGTMTDMIRKADIVQLMHTDQQALNLCLALKKKRIFVYHTGTKYRTNPQHWNSVFNPHVIAAFTDQTEFMGTGMKNEQYIATAINTDRFKPVNKAIFHPIVLAHFPSNPQVKGTETILKMMKKIKGKFAFNYSIKKVNNEAQAKRLRDCDIYIELFQPTLNGKPYGCYGVSAFEAAATGKIVVTQNIRPRVYADAYGECPFILVETEADFIEKVQALVNTDPVKLQEMQNDTLQWVINKHSYKATGERLKTLLNI